MAIRKRGFTESRPRVVTEHFFAWAENIIDEREAEQLVAEGKADTHEITEAEIIEPLEKEK